VSRLSSVTLGAVVALASIGLAHAGPSVTGSWKLSVGANDDPCVVTLAADPGSDAAGVARSTGDCNGVSFEHWRTVGDKLQLQRNNGTLVAWLRPNGNAFEGKRISDGKTVALNR
jgi:Protease inhibitor Inh